MFQPIRSDHVMVSTYSTSIPWSRDKSRLSFHVMWSIPQSRDIQSRKLKTIKYSVCDTDVTADEQEAMDKWDYDDQVAWYLLLQQLPNLTAVCMGPYTTAKVCWDRIHAEYMAKKCLCSEWPRIHLLWNVLWEGRGCTGFLDEPTI